MNPILQALSSGYSAKKILEYVSKIDPNLGEKIQSALSYGYGAEKVLKFVMQGGKSFSSKLPNTNQKDLNAYEQMSFGISDEAKRMGRTALAAGGAALGGLAYSNIPTAIETVSERINPEEIAQSPIDEAMSSSETIETPAQPPQPTAETSFFDQMLKGRNLQDLSDDDRQQLNFLAMISDKMQFQDKKEQNYPGFKNIQKKIDRLFKGKTGIMEREQDRLGAQIAEKEFDGTVGAPKPIKSSEGFKKGDVVLTEDDEIADVQGISGNNFLINKNGKLQQVPMESLRAEPEEIKNAKIVFDPNTVPEQERSASLAFAIPMPDRSAVINVFHDGTMYIYKRKDQKPFDESIIKSVVEGMDFPITSGETFMGAWNTEQGDSRGATVMKELVKKAQDINKEDDPSKELIFEKLTNTFTHGYLKEFMKLLKESSRQFSAKRKKKK